MLLDILAMKAQDSCSRQRVIQPKTSVMLWSGGGICPRILTLLPLVRSRANGLPFLRPPVKWETRQITGLTHLTHYLPESRWRLTIFLELVLSQYYTGVSGCHVE